MLLYMDYMDYMVTMQVAVLHTASFTLYRTSTCNSLAECTLF